MSDPVIVVIAPPPGPSVIVRDILTSAPTVVVKNVADVPSPSEIGVYTIDQVNALLLADKATIEADLAAKSFDMAFPSAITEWVIVHNLNKRPASVTLIDTAGEEINTDIKFLDLNTVIATFAAPTAGVAYVS